MKGLSAGLVFVMAASVAGAFLGLAGGGLNYFLAALALIIATLAAAAAYLGTTDRGHDIPPKPRSIRYDLSLWFLVGCFAIFAFRAFFWILFTRDGELRIQSPNNLGDLALHIAYIKNFANGVALWPDNPIFVASKMRYPAGTDLFSALLLLVHVDLARGLVWAGLLASLGTFYALFRWGGKFALAGFLFNGGVAGFQVLRTFEFLDYQGDKTIAWKSIPLSMFVTQRGLLYAIPAGLLLLWHWREKLWRSEEQDRHATPLPFWVELALYATMPLFHVHTFLALSAVLVCLFAVGDAPIRKHIAFLLGGALIPATFFVWLVSDNFHASSMLRWHPGWVMHDPDFGRSNFLEFWFVNFGIFIPLALALVALCAWRVWQKDWKWNEKLSEEFAFLLPAAGIFIFGLLFRTAPWEWDNLKLMVWSYFLLLPYLWSRLIAGWSLPVRISVCIALFGSGFVSLFGGLGAEADGFGFANRGEVDSVGSAIRVVPVDARFATFPVYNHPLLLNGRKVVMGYPGHLWTQGFNYKKVQAALNNLMNGGQNWRQSARALRVRYLFWGREEKMNYPNSTLPWENTAPKIASGSWGTVYDLESLEPNAPRTLGPAP